MNFEGEKKLKIKPTAGAQTFSNKCCFQYKIAAELCSVVIVDGDDGITRTHLTQIKHHAPSSLSTHPT